MKPKRIILRTPLPPGDVLMLTAAVRDLHRSRPGAFVTDVRTDSDELWKHNPYIRPLSEGDPDVDVIDCHYPIINESAHAPIHYLQGYASFLSRRLGVTIKHHAFSGDIYLSDEEKAAASPAHSELGSERRYWIVAAGGKYDFSVKWWEHRRYQEVVDHFRDRFDFVQIGRSGDFHPPLRGVIDLRGKTNLRELIRLVYRAQGVLCPITFIMHLAAAVPLPEGTRRARPCVVIAGGREQPSWSAYPAHQFIHTIGALDCCATTGCWKSRVQPFDDGTPLDDLKNLCVAPESGWARCMNLISPDQVVACVSLYERTGIGETRFRGEVETRNPSALKHATQTIQTLKTDMSNTINLWFPTEFDVRPTFVDGQPKPVADGVVREAFKKQKLKKTGASEVAQWFLDCIGRNVWHMNSALKERIKLRRMLENGDLTQAEYNTRIVEPRNRYEDAREVMYSLLTTDTTNYGFQIKEVHPLPETSGDELVAGVRVQGEILGAHGSTFSSSVNPYG